MADAVAEEIEDLKKDMFIDFEAKVNLLSTRVQGAQLGADRAQNEQAKLQFQIDRLAEEIRLKPALETPQLVIAPSQLAESEQRIVEIKQETRKLFDQMRHIMQAQQIQVQTCMRDIERVEVQIDGLRSAGNREDEFDLSKKILNFERELAQVRKESRAEVLELKQSLMDAEAVTKNLRHQVE